MTKKKIYCVIPAYNEIKHISDIINRSKKFCDYVIVVDDGSLDNTFEIAQKAGADTLRLSINMGKGTALKTGCEYAIHHGADIIIFIDADGQHDPSDIPKFVAQLETSDIVFAYRIFNQKMPLVFRFGNKVINKTIRILFGINLRDTQCGYRAFNKDVYRKIRWTAMDYTIESEMIAYTAKSGLKYSQVPIQTVYNEDYKGTTIFDGIKIVINMLILKLKIIIE